MSQPPPESYGPGVPSRPPPPRRPPAHPTTYTSEPSAPTAPPIDVQDAFEQRHVHMDNHTEPMNTYKDTQAQTQAQIYQQSYPHAHEGSSSTYPTQQDMMDAIPYNQAMNNTDTKKSAPSNVSAYTAASAQSPYAPTATQSTTPQLPTDYQTTSTGYPTQFSAPSATDVPVLPHYAPPAYDGPPDTAPAQQLHTTSTHAPPRSQTPPTHSAGDAHNIYEQQQYMAQAQTEHVRTQTQPNTHKHTQAQKYQQSQPEPQQHYQYQQQEQQQYPPIVFNTPHPQTGGPSQSPCPSVQSASLSNGGDVNSSASLNTRSPPARGDGMLRCNGEYKWDTQLLPEFTFPPLIPPSGLFPLTPQGSKDLNAINVSLDHQRKLMQESYKSKINSVQGEYFRATSSANTMKTLNNLGGTFSKLVTGKEDDKRSDRKAEAKEKKQKYMERAFDSYYFGRHTLADAMAVKEIKALKDWHIKENTDIARYEKIEAKNMATRQAKEIYDMEKRHKKNKGGLFNNKKKDVRLESREKEAIQGRFKAEQIDQQQRQTARRAHLQQLHTDQIAWVQRHFETFKHKRVGNA